MSETAWEAEIDRIGDERVAAGLSRDPKEIAGDLETVTTLAADNARLRAEKAKLREALEQYESALRWLRYNRDTYPALASARDLARAALKDCT